MDSSRLETQEDLDEFFDRVFPPFDRNELERMLEATRRLKMLNPADRLSIERLREAVGNIEDIDYRDMFRRESAMNLVKLGAHIEALALANEVEVLIERLDTLLLLTTRLFEAGRQQESLSILAQVETAAYEADAETIWQWQKVMVLDETAEKLLRAGYKQKAFEAWEKAIQIARAGQTGQDEDIDIALQNMVGRLTSAGCLDLAEQAAEMIWIPGRKEIALKMIAEAKTGHSPSP
jgi:tetratricopeptide (TPR) repeat protein